MRVDRRGEGAVRDPFGLTQVYGATGREETLSGDPRHLASTVGKQVDEAALHGYLCFSYVPEPRTIFDGVAVAMPPAALPTPEVTEGEPQEILLQLLRRAIAERLQPGATVGVYLSGGLDSSLIAALLVEAGVRPIAFTLDFGAPYDLELPVARQVAEHLGIPLRVVSAHPAQIARYVEATAAALPQPFGDGVTVPLYLLGRAAKDSVSEVWNGEGGDQLFGGWTNKPMIAAHLYDVAGEGRSTDEVTEYLTTFHRFWGLTDRLYTPEQKARVTGVDPAGWIRPALDAVAYPELLHRLRAANLRLKGAQNIAPRMVALAECHGLTVQAPFFDTALAAWTFALPTETILAGAREKYLLKRVAERFLPAEIVWREKRGMGVPTTDWCLSLYPSRWPVRRLLAHYLSHRRLRREGRFDPGLIAQLRRGEDPTPEGAFRKRRVGEKLWLLLMWELWREANGC